jgi:short-subunit dehydrogenase
LRDAERLDSQAGEQAMVTKERHGPWALIVGGSEGIAAALADQLGAEGINLGLVARKQEPLAATAGRV